MKINLIDLNNFKKKVHNLNKLNHEEKKKNQKESIIQYRINPKNTNRKAVEKK